MIRPAALALLIAGFVPPAQAQFNINLNRLGEAARNLVRASSDVSEADEIAIGRDMAGVLLGAAPLDNDPAMQRYVNEVGRWLALQTDRPNLPWRFGVLDAPQVNAYAAPGGYVFITRGLLDRMRSESELAGVLAHEIVHVLEKHHLKAIRKGAKINFAAEVLSSAMRDSNSQVRQKLVSFGKELYSRGLDKGDEFEADRLGIVIAARAGYDPYGLPIVLQTLEAMNPSDSALALMFKTHPAPAERLAAIAKSDQATLDAYASQPDIAERFLAAFRRASNR